MSCLDPAVIADQNHGRLEGSEAEAARAHLQGCERCRRASGSMKRVTATLQAIAADSLDADASREPDEAELDSRFDTVMRLTQQMPVASPTRSAWPRPAVVLVGVAVVAGAIAAVRLLLR
jgi:anti-sigma factor RsiW